DGCCTNPGTKNFKPFFAKISPGLVMFWTGSNRVLEDPVTHVQSVEFVVTVQNLTNADIFIRESLIDSISNWSFSSNSSTDLRTAFDTKLDRLSSVTKKVVRLSSANSS